jgi:hypothetical protein
MSSLHCALGKRGFMVDGGSGGLCVIWARISPGWAGPAPARELRLIDNDNDCDRNIDSQLRHNEALFFFLSDLRNAFLLPDGILEIQQTEYVLPISEPFKPLEL